jgi:hypothetical protein
MSVGMGRVLRFGRFRQRYHGYGGGIAVCRQLVQDSGAQRIGCNAFLHGFGHVNLEDKPGGLCTNDRQFYRISANEGYGSCRFGRCTAGRLADRIDVN